eukprot:CAMPEP_0115022186 /NCGR_PEP_ID=MMETSP0216-20121206/31372_1 /TAXON_ID=223996 /ORGANISM="Protocruzia adherens, Strain Boccale" /LENGTH=286 /DNA_ID=CAMNT_0002394765 /DNA_START=42 /DNA_END=902 /DNA_ORIENTATION=-
MAENQKQTEAEAAKNTHSFNFWDHFCDFYSQSFSAMTQSIYHEIGYQLKLQERSSLLVVGGGPGLGPSQLLPYLKPESEVVITDFSPKMVENAEKFIENSMEKKSFSGTVRYGIADATDLQQFRDKQFDRYVASLSLMHVPSPEKQVQEAYRVLDDDGMAIFVVWGREERCHLFRFPGEVERELGLAAQVKRNSPFDLSKGSTITDMLEAAGFKKHFSWFTTKKLFYHSGQQYADFVASLVEAGGIFDLTAQQKLDYQRLLTEKADAVLDNHDLLGWDMKFVVALK